MKKTIKRRRTNVVKIGKVSVGYPHPVSIQSMTTTATRDIQQTIRQINKLAKSGCEIIRVSVLNKEEALCLKKIKRSISIPLVADIHFDYRLALLAIENGCDAIRINPGNIYRKNHLVPIAQEAKQAGIAVRIGANSGSIRKDKYTSKKTIEDLMVKSALYTIKIFEKEKFYDIIISLKSSDIFQCIAAYEKIANLCSYPMHLGITAAGLPLSGIIKSSVGLGYLLLKGIGDTIRISLTGEPEREIEAAGYLLRSIGLRNFGPEIISCPTCGRCGVNLSSIAQDTEKKLISLSRRFPSICKFKVAVMGCEVNGPGEAKEADVGVACSRKGALIFAKGKKIKKIKLNNVSRQLVNFIKDEMVE